jgi:hypothetical protein
MARSFTERHNLTIDPASRSGCDTSFLHLEQTTVGCPTRLAIGRSFFMTRQDGVRIRPGYGMFSASFCERHSNGISTRRMSASGVRFIGWRPRARMMTDVWHLGLFLDSGIGLAIDRITKVTRAGDGSIWLDVNMLDHRRPSGCVLPA